MTAADESVITVDCLGKKFCKDLKRSMFYGLQDIGSDLLDRAGQRSTLRKEEFWALQDIRFAIRPGECVGIIGANGSGKSTLLKLISGIFIPDTGEIRVRGRVGSLIEVGTGFHPLLSGRENIYLKAAILGLPEAEIERRFQAIVDFAGIGEFLDMPVRHYSSGMYCRLGFSVSVFCDIDILIVDEALAVGDASFRMKCLNRINELKQAGKTILFVSHAELSVKHVADRCILLDHGRVVCDGHPNEAYNAYNELIGAAQGSEIDDCALRPHTVLSRSVDIQALSISGYDCNRARTGEALDIILDYRATETFDRVYLNLRLWDLQGTLVSVIDSRRSGFYFDINHRAGQVAIRIPQLNLLPGQYRIAGGLLRNGEFLNWTRALCRFSVEDDPEYLSAGYLLLPADYRHRTRQAQAV